MYRSVTDESLGAQRMKQFNAYVAMAPSAEPGEGPLSGVRLAVKDVFVDRDRAPTCGSNVHATWMSGTATVLERLRGAGAEIVAYANLHEWGVGTSSLVTATGPIRNPWDAGRIAGGSSGGSAVAVAAGAVDAAVGTDAGGSIRIPSACCGIVGLKPTHGAVPTQGFFADGSGVDHIGPMARSVGVARTLFEVMSATRVDPVDVGSLRLGIAREFFFADLDPAIELAVESTITLLGSVVSEVRDVVVDSAERSRRAMPALVLAGLLDRLAPHFEERIDDFQPETRDTFLRARAIDDDARADARRIQQDVTQGFADVFETVDVIVTPTLSAPPPLVDDPIVRLPSGNRSIDQAYVPLNAPMNHAGVPSLSMPCAELDGGTTVGITLTAARGKEDVVLALGEALEHALDGRYVDRFALTD
jgi:aspartyl-tRNA(Asn)/glutamyl-tRNA(Gln) amidotransferase subunit A